jgi:lysozyme family protein
MLDIDHDGDVDIDDIKALPLDKAMEVYRTTWWDKFGYWRINNQTLATKVFDMAVNMGARQAAILVQRACNNCGAHLIVDGDLGPQSMGAINSITPTNLLLAIKEQQLAFYNAIVRRDPSQAKFLRGWTMRADWPQIAVA